MDLLLPPLITLAQLATGERLPFPRRLIWGHLHAGYYVETLFHATLLASRTPDLDQEMGAIFVILRRMGDYAAYPKVLGGLKRELDGVSIEQLERFLRR
jgi:hypothetical protein